MSALLRSDGVTLRVEGRSLLSDVSFPLQAGEVMAVLGLNGAGKSTLLNVLAGEAFPSSGQVLIDGRPLASFDPSELAEIRALNAVEPPLSFPISVFDYVSLGRPFDAVIEESVMEAISQCHAAQWRNRDAGSLSSGELLRVQLARSLYQLGTGAGRVWLLDEPMAHLDLAQRHFVLKLLRRIATERAWCIVFSTHEPCDALAIADRAMLLRDGRVVAFGGLKETVTRDHLRECYGAEAALGAYQLD